jgi:plastocyanin
MHSHFRGIIILVASLSAAALVACGDDSGTGPVDQTPVPAATVQATPAITFAPGQVTVVPGGTVTFDFGTVAHDVFFDNAPAGAPANITAPSANKSVTLTFATKGTFIYNCHIHPGMRGTVVVKDVGE